MKNVYYKFILTILIGLSGLMGVGCKHSAESVDVTLDDAEQAMADNDIRHARMVCDVISYQGRDRLTEAQLGRLAILYMKLADASNSDDDIADATQCFRMAWKLSADSMRGFVATLSPEDLPHFVMLTRIGGSLDSPPDLSEEHYAEDSIQATGEHETQLDQ